MPLSAPLNPLTGGPSRQKILLYGQAGDGKSYSTFTIPNLLQQCGSPAKVFLIDTDDGAMRTYEKCFPHLTNLRLFEAFDWAGLDSAIDQILKEANPARGDWIICDLFCKAWDWVQDYFSEQVFKKGADEFFMEARKRFAESGSKNVSPFDGFKDWTYIKKLYKALQDKLILKSRCNVICCVKAATVNDKSDSESVLSKYGRIGMKPAGQKELDHEFHTVLFMQQRKNGRDVRYWMQSAKFRGVNSQGIDCEVNPVMGVDPGTGQQVFYWGWAWQYLCQHEGWVMS